MRKDLRLSEADDHVEQGDGNFSDRLRASWRLQSYRGPPRLFRRRILDGRIFRRIHQMGPNRIGAHGRRKVRGSGHLLPVLRLSPTDNLLPDHLVREPKNFQSLHRLDRL